MKCVPVKIRNRNASARCIVDDDDYELVSKIKWRLAKGYAINRIYLGVVDRTKHGKARLRYKTISMHRVIMGTSHKSTPMIDHINGNRLDNRKCNLRFCTQSENNRNVLKAHKDSKSGIRGVSWCKKTNKWKAAIQVNKVLMCLGYFTTKESACNAYKEASMKFAGEFSPFNRPQQATTRDITNKE